MMIKKDLADYDAGIRSRAEQHRLRAHVLRSAAEIVSGSHRAHLLERAEEYETLASSIEGLCLGND